MPNAAAVYTSGRGATFAVDKEGGLYGINTGTVRFLPMLQGESDPDDPMKPVKIMDGVAAIGGYQDQAAALKTDGSLWTWGRNCYGQLGSGSTEDSNVPVPVKTGVPGQDAAKGNDTPFSDVSRDAYYYEPVLWAVEKQITNGVTATQFSPGATCTRGEIITFLWRAMGQPEPEGLQNA